MASPACQLKPGGVAGCLLDRTRASCGVLAPAVVLAAFQSADGRRLAVPGGNVLQAGVAEELPLAPLAVQGVPGLDGDAPAPGCARGTFRRSSRSARVRLHARLGQKGIQFGLVEARGAKSPWGGCAPAPAMQAEGAGNDQQFLVAALELLECIPGEVGGVGVFSVDSGHGAPDFAAAGRDLALGMEVAEVLSSRRWS